MNADDAPKKPTIPSISERLRRRARFGAWLSTSAALLLLAACGSGNSIGNEAGPSTPVLMPSMPTNLCEVDDRPLNAVVSGALGEPQQGETAGQITCLWTSDLGERVHLMSTTVPEWMTLGQQIDTPSDWLAELRESGEFDDPDQAARVEQAETVLESDRGPTVAEACEIYALMMELSPAEHPSVTTRVDLGPGTRTIHQELPTADDMLLGQMCAHGRHYSLSVNSDHLDNSEAEATALLDALAQVAQDSK